MQDEKEKIALEEDEIFSNLTVPQIERCIKRLEWELEKAKRKEEERKHSDMPF